MYVTGSTVIINYSLLQDVYAGMGNLNANPLFSNTSDPDGPDNVWAIRMTG